MGGQVQDDQRGGYALGGQWATHALSLHWGDRMPRFPACRILGGLFGDLPGVRWSRLEVGFMASSLRQGKERHSLQRGIVEAAVERQQWSIGRQGKGGRIAGHRGHSVQVPLLRV